MKSTTEKELTEGIKREINYPLASLVSRLRRCSTERVTTAYIDEARMDFENALASSIAKAIKEAINRGISS